MDYAILKKLHVDQGLSTPKIAAMLQQKKNTVIVALRNMKCLRPAPGRAVEKQVGNWLSSNGSQVIPQRGDHPFDFMVDGERVDVKSASLSPEDRSYKFNLSRTGTGKKIAETADYLLLVFLDLPRRPIHKILTKDISAQITLSIPKSFKTKAPLQFIGHLQMAA